MQLKIYQADAFTDKLFGGNPAAVCPLLSWLPDELMQDIAAENNLAETAFYVKKKDHYEIRWFTPLVEVDLCGHATLAAAYILFHYEGHQGNEIRFYSLRSGDLFVKRDENMLTLNFPADIYEKIHLTPALQDLINADITEVFKGKTDYMFVLKTEEEVNDLKPDFSRLTSLDCRGIIVTAPGNKTDFVSRFFAPACGINEDPVTGSAHTTLTPYWSLKTGKNKLTAIQLSARRGYLECSMLQGRVEISGNVKIYLIGDIIIT